MTAQKNNIELTPENLSLLPAFKLIEHKKDLQSDLVTVTTTSQTFADMGITINANTVEITLFIGSTRFVHYNPAGTALVTNGSIPAGGAYAMFGNKEQLDLAEFRTAASTQTVTVIQHALL